MHEQEGRGMNRRFTRVVLTALAVLALHIVVLAMPSQALAAGATQSSGIAFPAAEGACVDPEGQGSDFALTMTGDLEGCHYVFVETAVCSPSGTYRETGTEIFVGDYNGQAGTFETTYLFTAKYVDCPNLIDEIVGRCQHPIVAGSGRGVFEGVSGRLDFKDDIEAGNFPYRGHLRW
jgi:hypothetical protein